MISIIGVLIALLLPAVQSARKANRRAQCSNNLKQLGIALYNYESTHHVLPSGGKSLNHAKNPAVVQFVDIYAVFPRLLPQLEQDNVYNSMNFNLDYNYTNGANYTACSTVISGFLCPSAVRSGGNGHDDIDPNDPIATSRGVGYGMTDYGPTSLTDINPTGKQVSAGTFPGTPFRDPTSVADGVLKHGSTSVSEIRDGLANSMVIAEDAGRDAQLRLRVPRVDLGWCLGSALEPIGPDGPATVLALGRARQRDRRLRVGQ